MIPNITAGRIFSVLVAVALLYPRIADGQNAPPAEDPMSLRTRDAHQNLTIVADPYDRASRYKKEVFGKKSPYDFGIIAIDVYFKNDNDLPIRLNPATMQLIISEPGQARQRIDALTPEDVADRALMTGSSDIHEPRTSRLPFPIPSSGAKHSKEWTEMSTALRTVALGTDVLAPHATTHGFLFFDLNRDFAAIHNSHLYIPDLAFMTNHQALLFFEIDLADAPTR
jgi:hypothetical protein